MIFDRDAVLVSVVVQHQCRLNFLDHEADAFSRDLCVSCPYSSCACPRSPSAPRLSHATPALLHDRLDDVRLRSLPKRMRPKSRALCCRRPRRSRPALPPPCRSAPAERAQRRTAARAAKRPHRRAELVSVSSSGARLIGIDHMAHIVQHGTALGSAKVVQQQLMTTLVMADRRRPNRASRPRKPATSVSRKTNSLLSSDGCLMAAGAFSTPWRARASEATQVLARRVLLGHTIHGPPCPVAQRTDRGRPSLRRALG